MRTKTKDDMLVEASRLYEEHYDTLNSKETVDAIATLLVNVHNAALEEAATFSDWQVSYWDTAWPRGVESTHKSWQAEFTANHVRAMKIKVGA